MKLRTIKKANLKRIVFSFSSIDKDVLIVEDAAHFARCLRITKDLLEKDTERTYVEVVKLGKIRRQENVDWSMLGMILSVLHKEFRKEA